MTKKVAIQGYDASFHDIAAKQFFGEDIELVCCETFADCFRALTNKSADVALCAIENSLYGSINEVYDLILSHKAAIFGEVYLRIVQNLIGLPGSTTEDILEVHSHPVALAQCEAFLDKQLTQAARFEHHDTAASVADIMKWNDPHKAAIASEAAAKLHGAKVLAREIETNKENYTRFVALSLDDEPVDATKTSLVLTTSHKPGSLYQALGCFAKRNINLSKLQSRPIVGEAWHYMFYIDVLTGQHTEAFQAIIKELQAQDCAVQILGSYKNARN